MLNSIKLGQYLPGDSWYYRLDPRNKLIMTSLYIIFIFLANSWQTYGLITLFTLIVVLTSGISLKFFYRSLRPIFFIMIFTFVLNLFFIRSGSKLTDLPIFRLYEVTYYPQIISLVLLGLITLMMIILPLIKLLDGRLGVRIFKYSLLGVFLINIAFILIYRDAAYTKALHIPIYRDALVNGGFIVLRLILIVSFSSLLTFTTKPTDLTLAIERVLRPLKVIKVPVSEIAIMISIALRFIPTLLEETQKILKAQTSRGADFSEGNIKEKIVQIISLLVPMFIISFKRAEELAYAMEARGFVPGQKRTSYRVLKWRMVDTVFATSFLIVIVLMFSFRMGWIL